MVVEPPLASGQIPHCQAPLPLEAQRVELERGEAIEDAGADQLAHGVHRRLAADALDEAGEAYHRFETLHDVIAVFESGGDGER